LIKLQTDRLVQWRCITESDTKSLIIDIAITLFQSQKDIGSVELG
jgi:hypothetical protein